MLLADAKKARLVDELSINKYKIPSMLLMENAGMRVADIALKTDAQSYCIVAGKGNNGGDGSVAARHIHCNGKKVTLILICDEDELKKDAKLMYETAKSSGVNVLTGFNDISRKALRECDVIIDAILGIGCTGAPNGIIEDIIKYINDISKHVIAIDVPSGVNATNGNVESVAIKCVSTVTFSVGRLGLMLYPAKEYAGTVYVEQISFVPDAINEANIKVREIEYKKSNRVDDCHKGSVGKVLVAAGSVGMTGAAYIASTSALKCGSGVVTLCIPQSLNSIMEQKLTEVMTIPVAESHGTMAAEAYERVVEESAKYDCLLMGCGLGNNENTRLFVNKIIENTTCPIVIDADGINCLNKDVLRKSKSNIVITPHIGEMSRLTGLAIESIKNNLCNVALDFAKEYEVTVVLKSSTTVIAFPNGEIYVNTKGNSGMATAGSGDALAGILASLIASDQCFENAVVNGVYLHSAAGDLAAERLGKEYMSAMDIVYSLKYVL